MDDYSDIVSNIAGRGLSRAAAGLDDDPDDAARSMQLSRATDVAPQVINADLPQFERAYKQHLVMNAIRSNPELNQFISQHPLGGSIANDDYANLSIFGNKVGKLYGTVQRDVAEGIEGGVGPGLPGAWITNTEFAKRAPYSAIAWAVLGAPIEAIVRGGGAAIGGLTGLATGLTKAGYQAAGSETPGNLVRDIQGMAENTVMGGAGHLPEVTGEAGQFLRAQEAVKAAKPWIDAGLEPPRGVHPFIDDLKASTNKAGIEMLNDAASAAEQSMLRARDPESFRQFAQQYGSRSISISADAIEALYGDELPSLTDGKLGWVPGIEDKLNAARNVGADVHIPIAEWLTNSTPELRKALQPDTRIWPGGITEREAAEPRVIPPTVDSPVAQVRGQAGLEPMFSWGDRKLELSRWGDADSHDFRLLDQDGNEAGLLSLTPLEDKKQLYINGIYGGAGLNANSFGPSLMRDLLRQIKALYPDYETITGHRVTGARAVAGGDGFPVIKLSDDFANEQSRFDNFRDILTNSTREQLTPEISAYMPRMEDLNDTQRQTLTTIQEELQRLTPGATIATPAQIYNSASARFPSGVFQQFRDRNPLIAVSLFADNPIGTTRHEAVHYLRSQGFFKSEEWNTLLRESTANNWLDKYNINQRYADLPDYARHEEAIAEAFSDWAGKREDSKWHPVVNAVFQRLADMWQAIKSRLAAVFGHEPTADEIFKSILSGEVSRREGAEPLHSEAYRNAKPKFSEAVMTPDEVQRQLDVLRASGVGLDAKSYRRIQDLVNAQHKDDLAAAMKSAEAEQKRQQTAEWKDAKAAISKEVEADIRQRPDVAADLFVGSGELNGNKMRQRIPLLETDLTDAQKSSLPDHYYSKSGAPVDAVASMFGFGSGDELVQTLAAYNKIKTEGGFTPQTMLRKIMDDEIDRRMAAKFGSLDANIASEAHDQAHSEATLNVLADEYVAAAMQAGVDYVDKDVIKAAAKNMFAQMNMGDVHYPDLAARTQKFADQATRQLLAGDAAGAVVSLQKRFASGVIAAEALKFQKEIAATDKLAKRWRSRVVTGVDPQYTNYIHDILVRIGKPVSRSIQDIAAQIKGEDTGTLEQFIEAKKNMDREIPIYSELLDPNWSKNIDDMSVGEYRAVADSLKTLAFHARDEMRIQIGIDRMNLDEYKTQLLASITRVGQIQYGPDGKRLGIMSKIPGIDSIRGFKAKSLDMENVFNRFDHFDPHGPWNQLIRSLIEGANRKSAWEKEFAEKLASIKDDRDLNRTVNNTIFRDPAIENGPLMPFTRKNLLAVMLNTGTQSNLVKLAKGYNLKPEQVMEWVHSVANKEDWDFVQAIWSKVFPEIKRRGDMMYRSMTGGVAPDEVVASPIDTPFGRYDGGYYPIIHHAQFEGNLAGRSRLMEPEYFKATTPNGWTKQRTGDVRPLSLSIDDMPGRINQMLHDIALRPAVVEASKIFYDRTIREAIRTNFGDEYRDMLTPYLESVANSANRMTKADQSIGTISGFMRQNLVSTLVGLNPGTVLKHGPSAMVTSMREVGPLEYLKATKGLYSIDEATGQSNWEFAMEHSLELQRRDRNWGETLYGATNKLAGGDTVFGSGTGKEQFMKLRERVMSLASKPVAFSDMLSAVPTWLASYEKAIGDGSSHGDAVYLADRAVRRAHGSTSITSRTGVMRDFNPWVTSVYNFFSDIMNRQVETVWRTQEALGRADKTQWERAKEALPIAIGGAFAYAIWPALIEELVSPTPNRDKDESWSWWATKGTLRTLSSSWVGVRDFVSALMSGRDPQFGLIGTGMSEISNVYRDLADKKSPFAVQNQGKLIQDGASMVGALTGLMPAQVGRSTRFLWDVNQGLEHPQEVPGWLTGMRFGTMKGHTQRWGQIGGGR